METKQLTKAERRIAICKDALAQLRLGKYKADTGTYVDFFDVDLSGADDSNKLDLSMSAQDFLLGKRGRKESKECRVCAKGAIFVSLVRKENKVPLCKLEDDNVRENKTEALFGAAHLDLIEEAFEGWASKHENMGSYDYNPDLGYKIRTFRHDMFPNDKDRLVAILENMVENDGMFKLDQFFAEQKPKKKPVKKKAVKKMK